MLKIVYFYNQAQSGFSETYYAAGADPRLFGQSLGLPFLAKAVTFRNQLTVLKAVRITRVEPPRFSWLIRPYPSPQGTASLSSGAGPDIVSSDAVIQLGGQSNGSRRIFMRGLSDNDVLRDAFGNDTMTPSLSKGIDSFIKAIIGFQYAIRIVQRPPNGGLVWGQVLTVETAIAGPGFTKITYVGGPPGLIPPLTVLSFVGIPGARLPHFPRSARVIFNGIAPASVTIPYTMPVGGIVSPVNMRLTLQSAALDPIATWQFERFSEHKTGRPFGSLRGRSRAVFVAR